jgi:NAD+--asparagine ADP-ribosyltransferase
MNKKETTRILNNNKDLLALYQKVVDKLEKKIATLEKVLESHAKCIGELRGTELRIHDLKDIK